MEVEKVCKEKATVVLLVIGAPRAVNPKLLGWFEIPVTTLENPQVPWPLVEDQSQRVVVRELWFLLCLFPERGCCFKNSPGLDLIDTPFTSGPDFSKNILFHVVCMVYKLFCLDLSLSQQVLSELLKSNHSCQTFLSSIKLNHLICPYDR